MHGWIVLFCKNHVKPVLGRTFLEDGGSHSGVFPHLCADFNVTGNSLHPFGKIFAWNENCRYTLINTPQNIMPDLLQIIDQNVPSVFQTMAGLTTTPGSGDSEPERPSALRGVTGSVSLSGTASGIVYAAFSQELAKAVSIRMLGCEAPTDEDISDVVGEFTNMITGNIKSQLCDAGHPCQLSIPSVMRGGEICVVAKSAPLCVRNTYFFADLQEELVVLVFAKLDN